MATSKVKQVTPVIKKWMLKEPATSSQIADGAEAEITFSIGSQLGANRIVVLRYSTFACVLTGTTFSGSNCTVKVRNISGGTHTISPRLLVVEYD